MKQFKIKELKHCPFCGGEVSVMKGLITDAYIINCDNKECGAIVSFSGGDASDEAKRRWNRRACHETSINQHCN